MRAATSSKPFWTSSRFCDANVPERPQITQRLSERALDRSSRLGSCHVQPDQFCRLVADLHLLGHQVMLEVRQEKVH